MSGHCLDGTVGQHLDTPLGLPPCPKHPRVHTQGQPWGIRGHLCTVPFGQAGAERPQSDQDKISQVQNPPQTSPRTPRPPWDTPSSTPEPGTKEMQVTVPQERLLGCGNIPGLGTKPWETLKSQMGSGCSSSTVRWKQLPTFLQAGTSLPCPSPILCLIGKKGVPEGTVSFSRKLQCS